MALPDLLTGDCSRFRPRNLLAFDLAFEITAHFTPGYGLAGGGNLGKPLRCGVQELSATLFSRSLFGNRIQHESVGGDSSAPGRERISGSESYRERKFQCTNTPILCT